jgi:hypothetical protein
LDYGAIQDSQKNSLFTQIGLTLKISKDRIGKMISHYLKTGIYDIAILYVSAQVASSPSGSN